MSFTVEQEVLIRTSVAAQGLFLSEELKTVEITYKPSHVTYSSESGIYSVLFQCSSPGCVKTGEVQFDFAYSGDGNVLDEAEQAFKATLIK